MPALKTERHVTTYALCELRYSLMIIATHNGYRYVVHRSLTIKQQ